MRQSATWKTGYEYIEIYKTFHFPGFYPLLYSELFENIKKKKIMAGAGIRTRYNSISDFKFGALLALVIIPKTVFST